MTTTDTAARVIEAAEHLLNHAILEDSGRVSFHQSDVDDLDAALMVHKKGWTIPEGSALPPDLAAVLAAHGVPHTVAGVLAAIEESKRCWVALLGPATESARSGYWDVSLRYWPLGVLREIHADGPTALIALARAFAAMVEGEC